MVLTSQLVANLVRYFGLYNHSDRVIELDDQQEATSHDYRHVGYQGVTLGINDVTRIAGANLLLSSLVGNVYKRASHRANRGDRPRQRVAGVEYYYHYPDRHYFLLLSIIDPRLVESVHSHTQKATLYTSPVQSSPVQSSARVPSLEFQLNMSMSWTYILQTANVIRDKISFA